MKNRLQGHENKEHCTSFHEPNFNSSHAELDATAFQKQGGVVQECVDRV